MERNQALSIKWILQEKEIIYGKIQEKEEI